MGVSIVYISDFDFGLLCPKPPAPRRILLWGLFFWQRQRAGIMMYGALRYVRVSYLGHAYLVIGGGRYACLFRGGACCCRTCVCALRALVG
jgi:hypothetical protein